MRVIESAGFYFPDSIGGTEVYVSSLAKKLQDSGIECIVAAPHQSTNISQYTHEGIEVFRYPFPEQSRRSEAQGRVPPRLFGTFEAWLREQRADVYHQHSWTTGCGLWHLHAAKQVGLKTLVTVHTPGIVCMRGTVLFEGRAACDGQIIPERCASCWLQSKGLPRVIAQSLGTLPQSFAPLRRLPGLGPALAANALAAIHKKRLQDMFSSADRIVAVCGWLQDALLANDVPPGKLVLSRQGVRGAERHSTQKAQVKPHDALQFGYLGRWDAYKGVHVLVEAFKQLPGRIPASLQICAVASGVENKKYREDVRRLVAGDRRVRFVEDPVGETGAKFLEAIDVLIVPSQWLETGPLVILEAFASGTPIIGSDLGGIKELVRHERDGLLVPHGDVNAWTAAMARLAMDREFFQRLRHGIGPVRTMSDVAHDMISLYRELFKTKTNAA